MITKPISFDDVLLVPQYSDITSRKDVSITSSLQRVGEFSLPIISSPMDTVTETKMALTMRDHGGLGIIHRYNTVEEQMDLVHSTRAEGAQVAAAIGVSGDFEQRACALYDVGANVLCIDVAHGHHILVKNALKRLREIFGEEIHIMAGNVATLEGFNDLADWGADSIRVGIGGGSICSTRLVTGHGVSTLQSIMECSTSDRDVRLIADGGMKTSGDIVKALAAGADFAILGSMLAGTDESPGQIFDSGSKKYKVYRGMASSEAQVAWRGTSSTAEGISTTIPYKGSVENILDDIRGGVRSGLSYTGAKNLMQLQTKSTWVRQSPAGQRESSTHILSK